MLPENYQEILKSGGAIIKNGVFPNAEAMRHDAEEYEACMMAMDDLGVPRIDENGSTYSIFGRALWMTSKQ